MRHVCQILAAGARISKEERKKQRGGQNHRERRNSSRSSCTSSSSSSQVDRGTGKRKRDNESVSLRMLHDPTRTQSTESLSEKQWLNKQGSSETTHPAKDFLDDDDDDNGTPTCCGSGAQRFSGATLQPSAKEN